MQTYEADTIDMTNSDELKARLDRCCKRLISSKYIVSYILRSVVPEYKDTDVETIMGLLGKIDISQTTVDMDIPPIIENEATEDNSINEGKRFYDIKFTARTPQDQTIALIINIEIQNEVKKYHLIKRAEYYCSRLISAQYNTVFTGSDFDKIQKVYSIWICTSPDEKHKNTISLYKMNREDLVGNYSDTEEDIRNYDLMNIIMVYLGDSKTKECGGVIRMLYSLLVAKLPSSEKKRIAHEEFGIPMVKNIDREVDDMCDMSSLYYSQGVRKTKNEIVHNLYKQNVPIDVIAKGTDLTVPEVERIIKEKPSEQRG